MQRQRVLNLLTAGFTKAKKGETLRHGAGLKRMARTGTTPQTSSEERHGERLNGCERGTG